MLKSVNKYSNSVIYKLYCKSVNVNDIYIGSTINMYNRLRTHKSKCNNNSYNTYLYKFIRDNGGWNNWNYFILENYNCENYNQLIKRERYWIEKLNSKLNSVKYPYLTEYEKNNYSNINKEKMKEYQKEYRKEYYEKNKQKIKEYNKKNKERFNQNYKQNNYKIICECGIKITKYYLSRHKKTKTHLILIQNINKKNYKQNNNKIICDCGVEVNKSGLINHKKTKKHFILIQNKTITN